MHKIHIIIYTHIHFMYTSSIHMLYIHCAYVCYSNEQKWKRNLVLICDCWNDGLGQTGSSVLCFWGMNLLVQNNNRYTTARAIFSVVQEREIEGMLC